MCKTQYHCHVSTVNHVEKQQEISFGEAIKNNLGKKFTKVKILYKENKEIKEDPENRAIFVPWLSAPHVYCGIIHSSQGKESTYTSMDR